MTDENEVQYFEEMTPEELGKYLLERQEPVTEEQKEWLRNYALERPIAEAYCLLNHVCTPPDGNEWGDKEKWTHNMGYMALKDEPRVVERVHEFRISLREMGHRGLLTGLKEVSLIQEKLDEINYEEGA